LDFLKDLVPEELTDSFLDDFFDFILPNSAPVLARDLNVAAGGAQEIPFAFRAILLPSMIFLSCSTLLDDTPRTSAVLFEVINCVSILIVIAHSIESYI
jgi:hypothetical protein